MRPRRGGGGGACLGASLGPRGRGLSEAPRGASKSLAPALDFTFYIYMTGRLLGAAGIAVDKRSLKLIASSRQFYWLKQMLYCCTSDIITKHPTVYDHFTQTHKAYTKLILQMKKQLITYTESVLLYILHIYSSFCLTF